jgi:hypothetical protein
VNPDPLGSISLLLQECNFSDIVDKSHIAYVLAGAYHESWLGLGMTEDTDGRAPWRGFAVRVALLIG